MNPIKWTTSDASSGRPQRPEGFSLVRNPDIDGYVNWMEYLPPSNRTYKLFCKKIGTFIAERHFDLDTDSTSYWMEGLPAGYALYRHHKTFQDKEDRNDLYLYGSRTGHVFRSSKEFMLHALWLMQGARRDECECKWCTGGGTQSQIEINNRYDLPGQKVKSKRGHNKSVLN